ncbi:hypothetical protein CDV31_008529 [Fusarium ambrosium]|uniref:Carboxypeptidase Y n=1 Tax=Fusarium ambrosium TaxID=131363 RepID=A0A428U066_9HYPO|nr:hypothetical protein CDV31_008529 [Fusarium ambrosium]
MMRLSGGIPMLLLADLASAQLQKPLSNAHEDVKFNVREQSPDLCDAGSRYWTGTVNITAEKSMFFWYFQSRNNPETDPLLLWMSGGPGATGELGCFMGTGPCAVNPDGNSTRRLDYSWTDHANVIYIDQPIGIGFSEIANRDDMAVSLEEGARDIYSFLSTLSTDVFPEFSGRPWHITGESMGGHYVTGYTKYIMNLEQERAARGLVPRINISSAVIVDGYIDASYQSSGYFDFFCTDWYPVSGSPKAPLMNETACSEMAAAVPTCELMGAHCRESYNPKLCHFMMDTCDRTVGKYFTEETRPGGWDPYDSRHSCEEPPLCSNFAHGETWEFFNQPWVQEKLGFSDLPFELIDFEANNRWVKSEHLYLPVTRELTWLLDNTDVRILIINGNNDIIINTPGQMRLFDAQPWKGQAQYRSQRYENWFFKQGKLVSSKEERQDAQRGGFWKGTDRLQFYSVDEAGHFAPYFQPESISAVLGAWLEK